jgi:hypothetical protein
LTVRYFSNHKGRFWARIGLCAVLVAGWFWLVECLFVVRLWCAEEVRTDVLVVVNGCTQLHRRRMHGSR